MRIKNILAVFLGFLALSSAFAQNDNYPSRKALIINNNPFVELSDFSFRNQYDNRSTRFMQDMKWKNIGTQPLVAFEIVILKYDAFDQRMTGTKWVVTGKNSADWGPLPPGQSSGDGTRGYGSEEVHTGIAYVRSARLEDGTVWRVNEAELSQKLKQIAPGIKDYGSTKPDPKTLAPAN